MDTTIPTMKIRKYNQQKKPKFLLIVEHGVFEKHFETVKTIKRIIGDESKFHIRYGPTTSNVFVETEEAYNNLEKYFVSDNQEFHTYSRKNERTHAFVLRGLNEDLDLEELKQELIGYNINIKNIYKMKRTRNPAYLVITDQKTTMKFLTQHVPIVNYTVVTWERHYSNKKITQCRRCQCWGHATTNYYSPYKRLKCAEDHPTINCTKTEETPAKCANCDGDHPANSTKCETYLKLLEKIHSRNVYNNIKEAPKKYIPAPLPKENPWEERRKQQEKKNTLLSLRVS